MVGHHGCGPAFLGPVFVLGLGTQLAAASDRPALLDDVTAALVRTLRLAGAGELAQGTPVWISGSWARAASNTVACGRRAYRRVLAGYGDVR